MMLSNNLAGSLQLQVSQPPGGVIQKVVTSNFEAVWMLSIHKTDAQLLPTALFDVQSLR